MAGRWPGEGSEIDEPPVALEDLQSTRGVVESIAGTDLVLRTDAGASVGISLGQPAYWEAQGVSLAVGEAVLVEGYEEDDGTLAASTVTVVATGQTVVLRDGVGRPMWSGGRRNAGARRAPAL